MSTKSTTASSPAPGAVFVQFATRHLRVGWWSLLGFLTIGIGLEALHAFKVGMYLNVSSQTRRLMWTLAHAHGVLVAMVHIVFGLCLRGSGRARAGGEAGYEARWVRLASAFLTGALVLLPGGFFLGGVYTYGGDPGLGSLLVPLGGVLLFAGVFVVARHAAELG